MLYSSVHLGGTVCTRLSGDRKRPVQLRSHSEAGVLVTTDGRFLHARYLGSFPYARWYQWYLAVSLEASFLCLMRPSSPLRSGEERVGA